MDATRLALMELVSAGGRAAVKTALRRLREQGAPPEAAEVILSAQRDLEALPLSVAPD